MLYPMWRLGPKPPGSFINAQKGVSRLKFLSTPLLLALLCGAVNTLQASCGSATCPLNGYHYLTRGWLRLTLAHEYINQDQIYVGSSLSFVGALPNPHDEVQTLNERNIVTLQYGLSDAFAVNVEVPFIHREHSHFAEGTIESFAFSGLGDIVLAGQYAVLVPADEFAPSLSFQIGAKLPTGVTSATSTAGERAEVTIQPGTGSLDGIFGVNFRQTMASVPDLSGEFSALPLIAGVSYQVNGRGTHDYRVGNTLQANVGTEYQFLKRAALLVQANALVREYADVGTTGEFRQNTGGTWIFISPGARLHLSDAFSAYGFVQIPVYRDVHGIQQSARFNLQFGLSASLALLE